MFFSRILTAFPEELKFRRGIFCQRVISVIYLSVAVSVFCIVCHLETLNLAVFSNIFIFLHSTIKSVVIPRKRPLELILLHCTGMVTPLLCDYVISSFLGIFIPDTNK